MSAESEQQCTHVNQKWRTNHKAVVQAGMLWGEVAAAVIHYPHWCGCWLFLESMMWNEMAIMGYVSRMRWCVFNFAQVPFQCVLWMPSKSAIKAEFQKNLHARSMIFEKKSAHQLDSTPWPPDCKSVSLPFELFALWFLMECCSSFLHCFVSNPMQNASWSPH